MTNNNTEKLTSADSGTYAARLESLYAELGAMFDSGECGDAMVHRMCAGVDALIVEMWRDTAGTSADDVDLLAVGGYGRGELCPQSDWDLWFLLQNKASPHVNAAIERFVYAAWDMNVKLGHAVRTVDETMAYVREDWNTATAGLESRLLYGNGTAYAALQKKIDAFFSRKRKAFVEAKLEEMERRHASTGGTAFLMEPDIKECKGGLRDVQTVFWLAKVWHGSKDIADLVRDGIISGTECRHLMEAQDFLWRCRSGLHLQAGRAMDRLDFEQQIQLAERMGYQGGKGHAAVEAFMQDYFRYAGRIARVSGLLSMHFQEELHPQWLARRKDIDDGFTLEGKCLGVRDGNVFAEDPLRLLRIFHAAQQGHRWLSSQALRQVREHVLLIDEDFRSDPEACRVFLQILSARRNVAAAFKQMNDTGVLGRFIPEFRHAVGLGQFNNYHAYTVDEHTIRAVGEARNMAHRDRTERLALAIDIFKKIQRPELLYLALLFHDIAKGLPGDHSELGEICAVKVCHRLGLHQDATNLVAWLARNHLLMAMTSQRSDLSDPAVIERFARQMGDVERLRYLLLLTVADIAAVGPNIWNGWKGALLRDLFLATQQYLMGEEDASVSTQERVRIRIESTLKKAEDSEREALSEALNQLPWRAVVGLPPRHLMRAGRTMTNAEDDFGIDILIDEDRGESLIMVLAVDRRGLFADIAAAMASGHINILAAQAYALKDSRVLDIFHIQGRDGKPLSEQRDVSRLKQRIERAADGHLTLRTRKSKPHVLMRQVPVQAHALPLASSRQTAIEVTAADRPGLLSLLAGKVADAGFNVRGASISTFGEKVVDVFFLTRQDGHVLSDEETSVLCAQLSDAAQLSKET
ncbi:MAG: [protein-PII] uridylyltransferase [Mariprofundaceae bacterium]|nr:[protein-PII] uridylyltransferase [Mariprofundaceae bacterium]